MVVKNHLHSSPSVQENRVGHSTYKYKLLNTKEYTFYHT
jgi:hypothetical protein